MESDNSLQQTHSYESLKFTQDMSALMQLNGTGCIKTPFYHRGLSSPMKESAISNVLFDLTEPFVLMESVCVLQMPGSRAVEV